MAPGKQGAVAVDLNAMLTKDRQRRKNEALAAEVFGKNRRASAPGAGFGSRKPATNAVPSLASRIGVAKPSRSVSSASSSRIQKPARPVLRPMAPKPAGDVNADWTHDLHNLNSPDSAVPRGPRAARHPRGSRQQQLHHALNGSASSPALNSQFNIIGSSKPGISIRGVAGPYIVVAKNLAPGTTVADIESAMLPIGGKVMECILIAEKPKVIAEIEFETKEGADNVVDTLNNQNADGNILSVYHKVGAPASRSSRNTTGAPLGPRADTERYADDTRSGYTTSERYTPKDRRGEREDIVDGSYGFEAMETDDSNYSDSRRGGLYSDSMVGGRGRDRGRGDSRDRGRGNNGGRGYNNR